MVGVRIMKFEVLYTKKAKKSIDKLDTSIKILIKGWIDKNLVNTENPRLYGKALTGNLRNYWRYRVGNYRIAFEIKDNELIVLAVDENRGRKIYN